MTIYSEQLLAFSFVTPSAYQNYIVPAGYRAVVRNINVMSFEGTSEFVWVSIAGHYVWGFRIPATSLGQNADVRQVAYAGQSILGYIGSAGVHLAVSGYLFADTSGRRARAGVAAAVPADAVEVPPLW